MQALLIPITMLIHPLAATLTGLVPVIWFGWTARGVMGTGWASSLLRGTVIYTSVQTVMILLVFLLMPEMLNLPAR